MNFFALLFHTLHYNVPYVARSRSYMHVLHVYGSVYSCLKNWFTRNKIFVRSKDGLIHFLFQLSDSIEVVLLLLFYFCATEDGTEDNPSKYDFLQF